MGFKEVLGFELGQLRSWPKLVRLLNRPEDPSSLALFRILFGLLMMLDIPNERGMTDADEEFSSDMCHFPLFDFLRPLSAKWMLIVYGVMFAGALGIMLGFRYRLACLLFLLPYWYLFFLDKTTWNNHSYLYGLIGFQLFFYDANRYLSIDSLLNKSIRNTHVPLWNYCILRTQIFLVYFVAGLKKLDLDWISGYSMTSLGTHWVFDPFKLILTEDQITLYIVHIGGLFIDLFVGYFLFFDKTRWLGVLISSSFHIMNSQMFNIGMFPYAMLATTTIFFSNDWPKRLLTKFGLVDKSYDQSSNQFIISKQSKSCIYDKVKSDKKSQPSSSIRHHFFTLFTLVYISVQLFLPYSHFITKGYNNWTNGLYGYSWDMMVHSWHTQHIKIHFVDKSTQEVHYLNPKAWTNRRRWSSHADMIYQYSKCIKEKLKAYNYSDVELYMDVWRSMNHRFNQRQLDPRVDLLKAEWSPWQETSWLMPLLTNLSDWRTKMKEIDDKYQQLNQSYEITFVADLNGLKLENFVSQHLNASVEVLSGEVNVELVEENKNYTLKVGQRLALPSNAYHIVHTTSLEPSCFFYIYINETSTLLSNYYNIFALNMMRTYNETLDKLKSESDLSSTNLEDIKSAAFNQTLILNSKSFLKMLTDTDQIQLDSSETNSTSLIENLKRIFEEKNLDKNVVYNQFVNQFASKFSDKVLSAQESASSQLIETIKAKLNKKLGAHWNRFNHRFNHSFRMFYYAVQSVIAGKELDEYLKTQGIVEDKLEPMRARNSV